MSTTEDWLHLKRYGYAPGNYMIRCHRCKQVAVGLDKRAITCKPCAQEMDAERAVPLAACKGATGECAFNGACMYDCATGANVRGNREPTR